MSIVSKKPAAINCRVLQNIINGTGLSGSVYEELFWKFFLKSVSVNETGVHIPVSLIFWGVYPYIASC